MLGTVINIVTILIGGTVGTLLGNRLPEKTQATVMHGLGLVTLLVGMSMALKSQNILIVMGSVLLGGVLGEWWRIEDHLESLGQWIESKVSPSDNDGEAKPSIARAFVTSSLIFCVGPLTVVGSILDGLTGNYQPLAIKSMLDGFAALAFGAAMGVGVLFSTITVLVYQGGLSLLAHYFGATMPNISADTPAIIELSATGGVLIFGIGFILLDIKRIRVGNFLPALFIAPLVVVILQAMGVAF